MPEGEHASLIRGAAWLFSIGVAGLLLAGWLYVRRKEDGSANDQASEEPEQELVRTAGIAEVPDAGSSSRWEREGEGSAAAEQGQTFPLELQPDRGEGEQGPGQELVEAPFLHQTPAADEV